LNPIKSSSEEIYERCLRHLLELYYIVKYDVDESYRNQNEIYTKIISLAQETKKKLRSHTNTQLVSIFNTHRAKVKGFYLLQHLHDQPKAIKFYQKQQSPVKLDLIHVREYFETIM
jgi:hypothetical protein